MTFFNKYLLECLQHDISSFRLFKDDISGLHRIKYFSHKHKLHFFVKVNYISPLENLVFLCVKLCYCSTKVTCISLLIFFSFFEEKKYIFVCAGKLYGCLEVCGNIARWRPSSFRVSACKSWKAGFHQAANVLSPGQLALKAFDGFEVTKILEI